MKLFKIALKISKYLLILMILSIFIIAFVFIVYSKKLDYIIPENLNVTIVDSRGKTFLTLNNKTKQSYVALEDIDQNLIDAFLSIEDKRFFTHKGVDVTRIGGAIIANIKKDSLSQGASTITQQYARNLFLSSEKTYKRKIKEIAISINLESKYSKNEILEGYLNSIYFGHGIYGVEDACMFYFNHSAKNITIAQAAVIASIPKGPTYYSPLNNFNNNKSRKELVIKELYNDGKISLEDMNNALNEEIEIYGKISKTNIDNSPYFQDIVIDELNELNINSDVPYTVYTTLDSSLNSIMIDAINKYYPFDSSLQIAIVAMNSESGEVLNVIGGKDYTNSTFNRATKALRQPGSSIKPFLYYAALENGFTPITKFLSTKTTFNIDGDLYSPTNYNDIYPNQEVTMAYALAVSDNIYAVKTHLFLGTKVLYSTLKDFGFSTKIYDNASLALGTSEVYLDELVTSYAKLASLGKNVKSKYIKKIVDDNGKTLYEDSYTPKQKYSQSTCYILSEAMTNMFDNNLAININVTGASLKSMLTKKYAGKSGSTDTDKLMIGYNSKITLGIWCGYDDNRLLSSSEGKFIKYIWAEIMENYLKGENETWYEIPKNVTSINLNPVTGELAKQNEYSKSIYFNIDNVPWEIFNIDNSNITNVTKNEE